MKKLLLILTSTLLTQTSAAANFICVTADSAGAVVTEDGDREPITIKGQTSNNKQLKNVFLYLGNVRPGPNDAWFEHLEPSFTDKVEYNLFDGDERSYYLRFPQNLAPTFQAEVSVYKGGYIGVAALNCTVTL